MIRFFLILRNQINLFLWKMIKLFSFQLNWMKSHFRSLLKWHKFNMLLFLIHFLVSLQTALTESDDSNESFLYLIKIKSEQVNNNLIWFIKRLLIVWRCYFFWLIMNKRVIECFSSEKNGKIWHKYSTEKMLLMT